ncbi:unnamed protein product [Discosporangium mesarthrocarpum]
MKISMSLLHIHPARVLVLMLLLPGSLAFVSSIRPATFKTSSRSTAYSVASHLLSGRRGQDDSKNRWNAWTPPQRSHRRASTGPQAASMGVEPLILTEENVVAVLDEAKVELSTLFGNSAENRGVGITGEVDFVDLDGPTVIVRLSGRFWHERTTVLNRVANFIQKRIPECINVEVEDPSQLLDDESTKSGGVM